jgi:hypothetical protein
MAEILTISRVISETHVKVKSASGKERLVYCDKGFGVGASVMVEANIVQRRAETPKDIRVVNV